LNLQSFGWYNLRVSQASKAKKLKIKNLSLNYTCLGKGDPVILLHGWGSHYQKLMPLAKILSENNWQVAMLDFPGFGKSDPPPYPWKIGDFTDLVLEFKRKIFGRQKVFFLGHSFGGRVAIKLAAAYPDQVLGLILLGSAGLSRGRPIKRRIFGLAAKAGKFAFGDSQLLRKILYRLAGERDYLVLEGVMKSTFKKVIRENLRPLLKRIKAPTLILWGEKDQQTTFKDALILDREIDSSRLVSFKNSGHLFLYKKPNIVAKEMAKWKGLINGH
jgi:pimeloyl-ACP methyl ester carboxylesterase